MSARKVCARRTSPTRRSGGKFRASFARKWKEKVRKHKQLMKHCMEAAVTYQHRERAPQEVLSLHKEMKELHDDILGIKANVASMRTDVSEIRSRLDTFTSDFDNLVKNAIRNNISVDDIADKLDLLGDVEIEPVQETSSIGVGKELFNKAKDAIIFKQTTVHVSGMPLKLVQVAQRLEEVVDKNIFFMDELSEEAKRWITNFQNMARLLRALNFLEPVVVDSGEHFITKILRPVEAGRKTCEDRSSEQLIAAIETLQYMVGRL